MKGRANIQCMLNLDNPPAPKAAPRRLGNGCLNTVVSGIRETIFNGEFRAEQQLPTETQLQEQWGVSRSVVREAMKILSSQGLVRVEPGRGSFVNSADITPLRQQIEWTLLRGLIPEKDAAESAPFDEWDALLDLRLVLEVGAAERAARHALPAHLEAMSRAIAAMRAHPGDVAGCGRDDLDFHLALAQATRNLLWAALLGSFHDLLRRYLELGHHGPSNALQTADEHGAILDAVRAGDQTAAAMAMRKHLDSSQHDLEKARGKQRIPFRADRIML